MKNKVLFIGLNHRVNDPRLMYRQMRLLLNNLSNIEIHICTKQVHYSLTTSSIYRTETIVIDGHSIQNHIIGCFDTKQCNILKKISLKIRHALQIIKVCKLIDADFIQASHVFELFVALFIAKLSKAKAIYDSHEDYFRMTIDYSKKSLKIFFVAFVIIIYELVFIRFYDVVFCTDEYLVSKYKKFYYSAKSVYILRNYPYINNKPINKVFEYKNELKLVYIGGVNVHRGVIECANYVKEYNEKHVQKLTFDVFSQANEIITNLVQHKLINHYDWLDYKELMLLLENNYDIGICLLLPIKKFYRNLPLKNFDYMVVGLPIITSNFGNLKHYIDESKSGICINPLSYKEFEQAINVMLNPENRKYYSDNGIKYANNEASFQKEGVTYLLYFRKHLQVIDE